MSLKLEFLGSERLGLTSVHTFSLKIEVTSTSCCIYLRRDTLLFCQGITAVSKYVGT